MLWKINLGNCLLKHEKALLIGNIIGSNIFNIASVLGITAIVQPIVILESSVALLLNDILNLLTL